MAAVLVGLARCILVLTLIAAPWMFGGAALPEQRWLFTGILVAGALAWLASLLNGGVRLSGPATGVVVLLAALIAIGAFQLAPHPHETKLEHAELTAALGILDGDDTPATARSLYPAATRLQIGRLALALCAFVSGAWLFADRNARHGLWAILALNGVAVVGFGLVQRGAWNGKLYWTIPLELGGQPFAAFVNRNNAAEYLSMCLAGALGLWAARRTARPILMSVVVTARMRGSPGFWERFPATTWAIMILLLFGGALATLSRAGALSAIIGIVLAGVWAGSGRRSRAVLLPLLGIVIAAGVWISLTQQSSALQSRLGSLTQSIATDGRLGHWSDMSDALRDFAQSGAGLGTYRYANKPYESRRSVSWFESADNQYLEVLVEGGTGAAVIMLGLLLLAAGVVAAWRRSQCLGEAIACGYLLIALGLQSITDCWWTTAANLLTLATLAGALSKPDRRQDPTLSRLDQVDDLIDSRRGYVSGALMGLCVIVAAGLGLYEVTAAAQANLFRRNVPDDERRAEITALEIDGLLAAGELLLRRRPDDAELHVALARLWYYRYRLQAAAALDVVAPERWSDAVRWDRTSPQTLFATLARYAQIGDAASLARFRDSTAARDNFVAMSEHVRAARRACPIIPHVGLFEAIAELLQDGDASPPLRREAALSPARLQLLHALARSAEMIGDDQLFAVCLSRCVALDPDNVLVYTETALRRLSEPAIVERLLPASPGPLLDFAEQARSPAGRDLAIQRARTAAEAPHLPEAERSFAQGRLAWLNGEVAVAVERLAEAVAAEALDPLRRFHYARALLADSQSEAARQQLEFGRRLAPNDRRLQSRFRELERDFDAP